MKKSSLMMVGKTRFKVAALLGTGLWVTTACAQLMPEEQPHNLQPPQQQDTIPAQQALGQKLPMVQMLPEQNAEPLPTAEPESALRLPGWLPQQQPEQPAAVENLVQPQEPVAEASPTLEQPKPAEPEQPQAATEQQAAPKPVAKQEPQPQAQPKADGDREWYRKERVVLSYALDKQTLSDEQRQALAKAIDAVPLKQVKAVHIVALSDWGPLQTLPFIGQHRSRYIKGFLRERGINTEAVRVSEIFMKTESAQEIRVDILYK